MQSDKGGGGRERMKVQYLLFYNIKCAALKGTVAGDGFLTISLYPRYKIKILTLSFGFCFSTNYENFIGSIFQPCEMASYIRAVREQNAIKILSLLTEKFHSAYSP
jgi:hypothetical protein